MRNWKRARCAPYRLMEMGDDVGFCIIVVEGCMEMENGFSFSVFDNVIKDDPCREDRKNREFLRGSYENLHTRYLRAGVFSKATLAGFV